MQVRAKKSSFSKVREMTRDALERDMTFAGFVVVSCPQKPDSKSILAEIQQSSHSVSVKENLAIVGQLTLSLQVIMITGDNALTACHVARELRMTRRKHTLLLDVDEEQWRSVDGSVKLPLYDDKLSEKQRKRQLAEYDICLTGDVSAKCYVLLER